MDFIQSFSYFLINIVLPIVGILTLIYLIILFNQFTYTLRETSKVVNDIQKKLDKLQGPIDTISDVHKKYAKLMGVISASLTSAINVFKKK